jgi:hypothetical protein
MTQKSLFWGLPMGLYGAGEKVQKRMHDFYNKE